MVFRSFQSASESSSKLLEEEDWISVILATAMEAPSQQNWRHTLGEVQLSTPNLRERLEPVTHVFGLDCYPCPGLSMALTDRLLRLRRMDQATVGTARTITRL